MKIKSRNLLTVILALLCTIALALGVTFLMPKVEKLNATAATNVPTYTPGEVSGFISAIYTDGQTMTAGTAVYEERNTALSSGYFRFSIEISVPAYMEYTVTYKMCLCINASFSGSGSATGKCSVQRYADSSYGTPLATHCSLQHTVVTSNNYNATYFDVANLVFSNDTSSAKTFTTYFSFDCEDMYKSGISAMYYAVGFSPNTSLVEVSKVSDPITSDTLTFSYDGNPHTVNFTYADPVELTDLDGNSFSYTMGYKNVVVSVYAIDGKGSITSGYTTDPSNLTTATGSGSITATSAGTYTVRFNLSNSAISNGVEWVGGGTGEKTLVLKINKLDPTVNPDIAEGPWYVTDSLVNDVSIKTTAGDTPGTISWDAGQTLKAGTNNYGWTFTPADTNNYNTKTGTASITVESIEIKEIKVKFTQGTAKFYTSSKPDDLKVKLGVFKVYNDGTEIAVSSEDYELDGDLSKAGTVNVKVTYTTSATEQPALEEFYGNFDVEITEVQLKSISATFNPAGDIYLSSSIDDLKDSLTVTGTYNDGSTSPITDYTLSTPNGGLTLGNVTVTVTPDEDSSITATFNVTVVADPVVIELPIPEANGLTYSGEEFDIQDEIANLTSEQIATYLDVTGTTTGRNAGEYTVKFKIKDEYTGSVKWETQTATPTKYNLAAKGFASAELSADGRTVELKWQITKAKVSAYWDSEDRVWSVAPNNLAETTESNFLTQVYTNSDGKEFTAVEKLAGGRTYQVTAKINPQYANNIELDEGTKTLMDSGDETYTYTPEYVPGVWEKIVSFLKANWLWFVIGLAALLLLIIIIVVAVKCRKSKEEWEAKKAAKEEEKARKEEERRRREEERRLQREKQEAEREMAKAKQEAELEKIRAQAQLSGAAGMAAMAVQQQPQQQVVDNSSNELLKEMREQMAELRADNKATQAQLLALQNNRNTQPVQPQYPMYQQQMPMMPMAYNGGDSGTLARLEAQLNAMQAEQRARYDAEQRIELAAFRAESHVDRDSRHSVDLAAMREHINGYNYNNRVPDYSQAGQLPYNSQTQPNPMDALGALVAATLKNMTNGAAVQPQAVAELPQTAGQSTVTATPKTPTVYPPDAVVTTTTTVDTTKTNPIRREENFDVDGFYDNFE